MKMRNFGRFTVSFWKVYHEKNKFWKIYHFMGIFPWIGFMGKFPWIYGTMPRGGGKQVKIVPIFSGHGGHGARGVAC
jgi:hypothetical protein